MKEATGELNMTVVTVVAIAAVGAFFYLFIWPSIKTGLTMSTCNNICPNGKADHVDKGICCCDAQCTVTIDPNKWDPDKGANNDGTTP